MRGIRTYNNFIFGKKNFSVFEKVLTTFSILEKIFTKMDS